MQIPTCLIRKISVLQSLSVLGTFALFYTIFVALLETPYYMKKNFEWEKVKYWDFNINVLKVTCMYFFAYNNHNAILNILRELSDNTKDRGKRVKTIGFIIQFISYLTVIIAGYLATLENTSEIFIDRRENQSIFIIIGKMCYIVSLTAHIALYYFISRPSLENLFLYGERFTETQYCLYF